MLRTVDDWKTCCAANPRERPRKGYFATFRTTGRVAGYEDQDIEQLANALQAFAALQDEDP